MLEVLLTQVYVVVPPVLFVEKVTSVVDASLHTTWSAGSFTWAVGLTVIVNVFEDPVQVMLPFSN